MGYIRKLSRDVSETIAAGEVVERPSAVVKELIENSLDAKATSIDVIVEDSGCKRIEIVDDGRGILPEDMQLAVERYATSKIETADDLNMVSTFGFRGEALAAIAAVSKLTIESKAADIMHGRKLTCHGGSVLDDQDFGCPAGTCIVVSDLFYNTPARLKFLRSKKFEMALIQESFLEAALANPNIRFSLQHNGKRISTAMPMKDEERVREIIGGELTRFTASEEGIQVSGWLGDNSKAKWRSGGLAFVNRRPVLDKLVRRATVEACDGFFEKNAMPVIVIFIEIDPMSVDVNVHPTKREVRFSKPHVLFNLIVQAIRSSLMEKKLSIFAAKAPETESSDRSHVENAPKSFAGYSGSKSFVAKIGDAQRAAVAGFELEPYRPANVPKPIGQLSETYVVCEGEDGGLIIIDQHAAHERLMYDQLKKQLANGRIVGQPLLIPFTFDLSPSEAALISEKLDLINSLGFDVEIFGERTFNVRAVPAMIAGDEGLLPSLFEKLAVEISEGSQGRAHEDFVNSILATIACHRQVRAGQSLTHVEMERLAADVFQTGITHCPHGRPAVVKLTRSEVDKWFNRN